MRHFLLMLSLLTVIFAAAPAFAQSDALKEAWRQTNTLLAAEKYAEAESWIKKAVDLALTESGADSVNYSTSLDNQARLYYRQGNYTEAETLYKRALAIVEKALGPDHPYVATVLNNMAELNRAQGRYAEAEPLYKRSLAIREKAFGADHPDVAIALNNLAEFYQEQDRYAEAEPLLKRALAIREKAPEPDHSDVAQSLNNIAELYRAQGRYAEAEPLYKSSLAIREKALGPDHPDVAQSLNNLATLYIDQGRYAEAEPLYKRALAIDEKALGPDHPGIANNLNNLAELYQEQGRYAEAEPLFKRALAIREKVLGPDHPIVAESLNNLAGLYLMQGRYDEAEPLFKRTLAIEEKVLGPGHSTVAAILNNLGLLYFAQGRYVEAEPLYKRSLVIREKALGPDHPYVTISLANLAVLYRVQDRYAEELPFIRRAAAITTRRVTSTEEQSKGVQSELRSQRDIFLEEAAVTAVLMAAKDPRSPRLREEGFAALQWSKASDTAAAVAHMAVRFAAGSDALAALVRQRQDTQDRLDADAVAILKAVSQPPSQRDTNTEAALRADADNPGQRLKQLDAELATKFPRYAELANPKPLSITETQNLLAPDQAMIVFAIGMNVIYVAVVSHDDYEIGIIPVSGKDLSATVKELRATLDPTGPNKAPPFAASTAYKLYQQLLAHFEPMLKRVTHLYVVTDGALESLPLGVLLTQKPVSDQLSGSDLIDAPWLVRRYAVSVLPSVSSLKALRLFAKVSQATKPFMGIGNPVLKDQPGGNRGAPVLAQGVELRSVYRGAGVDQAALRDLPSLPGTADELLAEAKLLQAGPNSLLLGPAATVTAVMHADLVSRRVITFATHGLLAGDVGVAEPGLVLTPPGNMTPPQEPTDEDDGVLKASQIALLKLNADLVILSACNTAGPNGTPGAEGFSGLAKAFLYAGARTLVVSNWAVNSKSTVALMEDMQAQTAKGLGRAAALQQAELDLMSNPVYSHPLFWAPFVVVGEGGASKQ